ncbi:hypothetical protein TAFFO16_264 [Bacillus phage Taffo16]|uniref:Uncharacterized protein n=1 Tax=Bacillus phage Taffo16 TaxID=2030094 RepID=A0A249XVL5_9CAUD|nr:hypothetical protein TAFFO16_264 [Bacillus phage Taffo16]
MNKENIGKIQGLVLQCKEAGLSLDSENVQKAIAWHSRVFDIPVEVIKETMQEMWSKTRDKKGY